MSCNRFNEAHKNGYLQAIKRKNSKEIMLNHHESSPQKLQDLIRLEKIDAFLVTERSSANLIENSFVEAKISIPENFYILSLSNLEKKGDSLSSFDSLDRPHDIILLHIVVWRSHGFLSFDVLGFWNHSIIDHILPRSQIPLHSNPSRCRDPNLHCVPRVLEIYSVFW